MKRDTPLHSRPRSACGLYQQAASQPLPLTSRRISHEQGFAYHTAPPAHSRRAAHFLKPLPIAALATLLAAPAAWAADACQANTNICPTCCSGSKPSLTNPYTGNDVTVADSTYQSGFAYGGWSKTDEVTLNFLTIDSTGKVRNACGGYASGANLTANDNTLTINGTVNTAYGGYAYGTNTTANDNTLTINGTVDRAYGGEGRYAEKNEVFIESGATVKTVYGGWGGDSGATGNSVTISGGKVTSFVSGGKSYNGDTTGNFVTITGGTVEGDVYGGFAGEPYPAQGGNATGNIVTLAGGTVMGRMLGGDCFGTGCGSSDTVTGNTLKVQAKGLTVGGDVGNFDTLNFDLGTVGANDVVLDVGGTADFSKVTAAKFSFNLADGSNLKPGDTITLIKAGSLNLPALPASVTACGHEFELSADANTLTATVKEPPTPDPTPGPTPYYYSGDNSSPTLGELGLLLSGLALAGAAAPALRRREKQGKKADTRQ